MQATPVVIQKLRVFFADLKQSPQHIRQVVKHLVKPNARLTKPERRVLGYLWLIGFGTLWTFYTIPFFPHPAGISFSLKHLWLVDGLADAMQKSISFYFMGLVAGTAIASALALLTILPLFRPPVYAITNLRFLTMAGVNLFFMVFLGVNDTLKFTLMTFYQTIMLLPMLLDTIDSIERERYDYARTIYASEWKVSWRVIVRGRMAEFIRNVRMNLPVGWAMLFIVEGYQISGGGIGALMAVMMKHPDLNMVGALLLICGVVGLILYKILTYVESSLCPWAALKVERR